jgi:hypothetical protein
MPDIILVICNLCPCPMAGFEKQLLEHDFELLIGGPIEQVVCP